MSILVCEDQGMAQMVISGIPILRLFLIRFSRVILHEILGKVRSFRDAELVVCGLFLNPNNISVKINLYFFRIFQVSQNCVNHI